MNRSILSGVYSRTEYGLDDERRITERARAKALIEAVRNPSSRSVRRDAIRDMLEFRSERGNTRLEKKVFKEAVRQTGKLFDPELYQKGKELIKSRSLRRLLSSE